MNCRGVTVDPHHQDAFGRLLLKGTENVLKTLENMFELDVPNAESLLQLATRSASGIPAIFGEGPFYTISSELNGDLAGRAMLLLDESDVEHLAGELMPVLSLMFLSDPGVDLTGPEHSRPAWLDDPAEALRDEEFRAQVMDALAELCNVVVGVYTRSIFEVSTQRVTHGLPVVGQDCDSQRVDRLLTIGATDEPTLMMIDNQILIANRFLRMWCVIVLDAESFRRLLVSFDEPAGHETPREREVRFAQTLYA